MRARVIAWLQRVFAWLWAPLIDEQVQACDLALRQALAETQAQLTQAQDRAIVELRARLDALAEQNRAPVLLSAHGARADCCVHARR